MKCFGFSLSSSHADVDCFLAFGLHLGYGTEVNLLWKCVGLLYERN
jgi:hypothetical protein